MIIRFRALFVALVIIGFTQASAAAGVIFDNTTTPLGSISFTALPIGNEVSVSGAALSVTDLEIGVNQQGVAGTANLQAFLYANDGLGGEPGTLLWNSSLMTNVALTGGNDLIAFAVPGVVVPSTFTWAIQISDTQPIAAGLPGFDPPTVGGIVRGWFGGPGSWTNLDGDGVDAHYMARITASAVPEPSAIVNGGIALLIGFGWMWSRRRRMPRATR
jgi:hypothetical protein